MATPPDFTAGQVLTAAQMNAVGLWKVTPTSVTGTGASIDSNGDVVVSSGGSNVTLNGVFSADFKNYKILASEFLCSAVSGLRLAMGTTITGTSHRSTQLVVPQSGVLSASGSDSGYFVWPIVCRSTTDSAAGNCELYSPFLPIETSFVSIGTDSDITGVGRNAYGRLLNNTSYTACYVAVDAGNINDLRLSVYGFN